jgi:hypothetical protein
MYLTAFLTQELARIAQLEREAATRQSRLVHLAAGDAGSDARVSLLDRIALAVRPAPATCTPAC